MRDVPDHTGGRPDRLAFRRRGFSADARPVETWIDGKMYLNIMQGDGTWASVTVKAGRWTTFDIEDTSDAAF
ncbi:MAG TPA: hypothetical protein VFJ30_12670 [Phycisphaerae bacterium]|nr:hypothetical protein [Phycisphaerae bacterium]